MTGQGSGAAGAQKPGAPKSDAAKQDAATSDSPRADAPKAASPKGEAPKGDTPKGDAPKGDAGKPASPAPAAPKGDVAKAPAAGAVNGDQRKPQQRDPQHQGPSKGSAGRPIPPQHKPAAASGQAAQQGKPGQGGQQAKPVRGQQEPPWQRGVQREPQTNVRRDAPQQNRPAGSPPAGGPKTGATPAASGAPASGKPAEKGPQSGRPVVTGTAAPGAPRPADREAAKAKQAGIDGPTRHIQRNTLPKDMPDLSEAKHPTPQEEPQAAEKKKPYTPQATPQRVAEGEALRATVQIRRVDPWTTLKVSSVLSVSLFLVWMVAVGLLYLVLDGMGVWDRLNGAFTDLVSETGAEGLISAGQVFGYSAIVGLVNMVLFTALATVGAFIYNMVADLVGGLEVTLADRD
ncbi:proline rich protein [Rhodococcus rhodnii LMG 5362]|uniref:Proline rich protein n=1 Tax=Rhodococcus rhodnii LMG 5362 TaxID=1273125 RepID=R7WK71_9NOCA|nr:proline rich protein [Rhodococcus rhodnii LMG 5362]